MKKYAVKRTGNDKILSILSYDEKAKTYQIDIPEDVSEGEAPFLMALFLQKGCRHIDEEWSMRWVRGRIIPSSRQNIGQILRENHMSSYDEHQLLMLHGGRCCQDELYLEGIDADGT